MMKIRSMKVLAIPLGLILALPFPAMGAETSDLLESTVDPVSTSVSDAEPRSGRPKFSARVGYSTMRASPGDTRSFKALNKDESGGSSDRARLPNKHYISAGFTFSPTRSHQLSLSGNSTTEKIFSNNYDSSQESDASSSSRGEGGGGKSQSLNFRYRYSLSRQWSLSVSDRVTAFGGNGTRFADPSVGVSYRSRDESGWGSRSGLSLTAPVSNRSREETLITRATARTGLSFRNNTGWTTSANLSYSRPFYSDPEKAASRRNWGSRSPDANSVSSLTEKPSRGSRGGRSRSANAEATASAPSASDQLNGILRENETDRTTGSLGLTYAFPRHWKLGTGCGISYVQTVKQNTIWSTSAKILGVSYSVANVEVGSNFQMYSNIEKRQHPSLPSLWGVDLQLSVLFGDDSRGDDI